MGGGASKRKKQADAEAATKAAAKAAKDQLRKKRDIEKQFKAYQDSLRDNEKSEKPDQGDNEGGKKGKKEENQDLHENRDFTFEEDGQEGGLDDVRDRTTHDELRRMTPTKTTTAETVFMPEQEQLPPVQILNPQVFNEFSPEFRAHFVEGNLLGQQQLKETHRYQSRHKKVDKVKIYGIESGLDRNSVYKDNRDHKDHSSGSRGEEEQDRPFEVASYPWLKDLCASFVPPSAPLSVAYLVDAKNRSIASIKEINKTHLDTRCLALDISSNRFNEIYFKHTLSQLLYLNVAGNLLVSLEGIHCCKHLIGLNASNNLITTLNPVKFLLSLESLIVASNKLCHLFEVDTLTLQREKKNNEIIQLTNETSNEEVKKNGWKPLPPSLKRLDVSFNSNLTSLEGVGHMPCLEYLDCSSCGVTRLHEELSQLPALTYLNLRNNKISHLSDVTNTFSTLTSLTCVDFSRNEFVAKDEKEGRGVYYLAMLELSQGRLKMLDDRKIIDKDYKRYIALKSEIQCEELVANLNVECCDKNAQMSSLLENLSSRHRLEEEVLREAIRGATIAENKKYTAYTTFVNEQLRELKIKEKMSSETVGEIQNKVEQMKKGSPLYIQPESTILNKQQHSQQDSTDTIKSDENKSNYSNTKLTTSTNT